MTELNFELMWSDNLTQFFLELLWIVKKMHIQNATCTTGTSLLDCVCLSTSTCTNILRGASKPPIKGDWFALLCLYNIVSAKKNQIVVFILPKVLTSSVENCLLFLFCLYHSAKVEKCFWELLVWLRPRPMHTYACWSK